jgi:hypothetical protein
MSVLPNYFDLTPTNESGMTNLAVGSIVSFLVTIPSGNAQVQFKVRTAKDGAVVSTATNSNTTVVTNPATPTGIMNVLPNYFDLTPTNESQVITLSNSGNGPISSLSFTPSSPLTQLSNNCGATLAAGASCQYVVKFDKNIPKAGTSGITVNYNNGISAQSATATVNYTGVDPIAGLTITSDNANFDFTSRTATPTQTSLVTLTNSGNSDESGFHFSPVTHFSTNTSGITENPCTPSTVLAPSQSCNLNLVYNNSTISPSTTVAIPVSYKYGQAGLTGSSSISVTYQTIQSTAILSITPNPATFTGIINNGLESSFQTLTVSNTGDETATNIASNILGNDSSLFTIANNSCVTSLPAGGNCTQSVRFGSTTGGQGTKNASLDISYVSYTGALASTSSASLSGVVSTAQSAIINSVFTSARGYVGGNGESQTPYQVQQEPSGKYHTPLPRIIYTITNTGSVAANNFYISPPMVDTGWELIVNNCGSSNSTITLNAAGGNCTIEFEQSSTENVGSYSSLNLSGYTASWVDQDSPRGESQALTGITYVNIFPPASIAVTTSPESNISITPGDSFTMTATLSGGYNVAAQTINAATSTSGVSFAGNNCTISSESTSCTITAQAESNAALVSGQSVTLSNSTTLAMSPSPSSIIFSIIGYTPFSFGLPVAITLNPTGTVAFITNNNDSTVTQCSVEGGNLRNCADSGATGLTDPIGITLNSTGTIAFIINQDTSSVTQCSVSGGTLSACTNSGATGLRTPFGITLNSTGTIAFITNANDGTVTQCSVSGGTLSACANSGATNLNFLAGITLNPTGTVAFIVNYSGTVTQCSVSGGTLSACANSGATGLRGPIGITLNPTGTVAFITDFGNTVTQCSVSGGTLSACALTGFAN